MGRIGVQGGEDPEEHLCAPGPHVGPVLAAALPQAFPLQRRATRIATSTRERRRKYIRELDDRSSPQANLPARRRRPASVPGPLPLFRATQCALRTPRSRSQFSARQPSFEQTIRAEGSWPARTRASTALRPCVLKAIRVSFATVPRSRLAIAVRDTSTTVEACRPSSASSRTTQEAPTSFEPGSALTDSLTRHATASP